jgi:hypothetical protein
LISESNIDYLSIRDDFYLLDQTLHNSLFMTERHSEADSLRSQIGMLKKEGRGGLFLLGEADCFLEAGARRRSGTKQGMKNQPIFFQQHTTEFWIVSSICDKFKINRQVFKGQRPRGGGCEPSLTVQ